MLLWHTPFLLWRCKGGHTRYKYCVGRCGIHGTGIVVCVVLRLASWYQGLLPEMFRLLGQCIAHQNEAVAHIGVGSIKVPTALALCGTAVGLMHGTGPSIMSGTAVGVMRSTAVGDTRRQYRDAYRNTVQHHTV